MTTLNQSYKELAIPYFKETFDIVDAIMKKHELPYYLIGVNALDLELLRNGHKPNRGTKDIDFAVMLSDLESYDIITSELEGEGFRKVKAPYTFYSEKFNLAIDILPFGEIEENYTVNFNERNTDLHVLGFSEVLEDAVQTKIEEKLVNIPPLEGMVILKLVAWSDRPEERGDDLPDIIRVIQHYYDLNFDEIVEYHNDTFPDEDFDQKIIAAEVLGRKILEILKKSDALKERILKVLDENLKDPTTSKIAKQWAVKMDSDVEYAYSILEAFKRGILIQ